MMQREAVFKRKVISSEGGQSRNNNGQIELTLGLKPDWTETGMLCVVAGLCMVIQE